MENIWIITESLNILYRENWTRLAAQEIARFQDQLVKRITEDMMATQNAGTYTGSSSSETVTERRVPEYEWNFAKAFLYSLTVLTTIGEFCACRMRLINYIPRRTYTETICPYVRFIGALAHEIICSVLSSVIRGIVQRTRTATKSHSVACITEITVFSWLVAY